MLDLAFAWIYYLLLLIVSTLQPIILRSEFSSPLQACLPFLGLPNPVGKPKYYPRILKVQNPLGSMLKFMDLA